MGPTSNAVSPGVPNAAAALGWRLGVPNAAAALGWRRDASLAECQRTSETRHLLVDIRREHGMALLVAMMAMLLMTALGAALVLTTSSEAIIAGNFRNSREGLYAAEAVLEQVAEEPGGGGLTLGAREGHGEGEDRLAIYLATESELGDAEQRKTLGTAASEFCRANGVAGYLMVR